MSLPSGTTFSNATCVNARIEYPLRDQGDAVTKVYHHTMQQALTSYAPLADDDTMTTATEKPERSPFPDDANAFFIGDSTPTEIDGGLIEWVRSFANIPQDLIVPNGFYAFEFPDVPGGIVLSKSTTSESSSYNTSTLVLTITATLSASDAANFNNGDVLSIYNPATWTYNIPGILNYTRTIFTGPVTKSGNTITMTLDFFYLNLGVPTAFSNFTDNGASYYDVKKTVSADRNGTEVINSPSLIQYRYIKNRSINLIQLKSKFELVTSTGDKTSATSTTTIPFTTAQYQTSALNSESIPAENETIEQWRGNIYRLSQIFVKMK